MPNYRYYGRNAQGEAVSGFIDRADRDSVVEYLSQQRIIPVNIDLHQASISSINWKVIHRLFSTNSVPDEQLIMFCRQMYTINKAGLSLAQGMKSLSLSMTDGALKESVNDIVSRLQSGMSLSLAMRQHSTIFNNLFISMIQVGENSGNLDTVFLQLSHYIKRDLETRKSIKAAMRYPLFVLTAMIIAMVVINIFVIPAFADMFSRFEADLPLATHLLIGLSNFFVNYWWLLLIASLLIGIGCIFWLKTNSGRALWDCKKLKIPIVGALINKASLARYARSFSIMLKAGVPLTDAIGLCAQVIDNQYFAEKIDSIKNGVERGDSLKRTHTRSEIFTPLILQMINVGESSGQVDTLLLDVADYYEREVEYDLKSLSSKIEPLLIVVMAVFVLVLALGIFLPMWEMYNIQK